MNKLPFHLASDDTWFECCEANLSKLDNLYLFTEFQRSLLLTTISINLSSRLLDERFRNTIDN